MAHSLSASRAPTCLNCLRQAFHFSDTSAFASTTRMQWRGKKKLPRALTLPVRLLVDVPRFGRKGSVVGVPPSVMRNQFFRNRVAEYLTLAEKKALSGKIQERDRTFGVKSKNLDKTKEDLVLESNAGPASVRPSIPVSRMVELLEKYVPLELEYRRPLIQTPAITLEGAADPDMADAAVPTASLAVALTSREIAEDIRARLAVGTTVQGDAMAAKIRVDAQDVEVVKAPRRGSQDTPISKDAITVAGDYEIVIHVAGSSKLTRKVRIVPGSAPEPFLDQPTASAEARL